MFNKIFFWIATLCRDVALCKNSEYRHLNNWTPVNIECVREHAPAENVLCAGGRLRKLRNIDILHC
jgi:hypothetical protein